MMKPKFLTPVFNPLHIIFMVFPVLSLWKFPGSFEPASLFAADPFPG
jgi:hypothetical protein